VKNILITGAGHGIGFSIAKHVQNISENLILLTKPDNSLCHIKNNFPNAKNFGVNLLKEQDIIKVINIVKKNINHIDVIVNNAGFYVGKIFEKTKINELDDLYKIQMKAPFIIIQKLLPLLKLSECPQIINICSAANFARIPGESAYTAAKAGLSAFGDVLRSEFQRYNIRVTNIYPWTVNTKNFKNSENFLRPEDIGELVEFIINTHPKCQIMSIELSSTNDWKGNWPPWISLQ
jgi:NADP-dependent 3-hydroxy acid dehydrogenase YdfG